MLRVALTGNRYSGKTKVSELFKSISIPVFDADTCIKYLLCHNFEFTTKVQKQIHVSLENGLINTCALDKSIDIIEPEIFRLYNKFCDRNNYYTIFESSILFERGWNKKFNFTINVFAPVSHRVERCKSLTGIDYSDIYDFTNNEILDERKNNGANFVIHSYIGAPNLKKSVNEVDTKIIDHYLDLKNSTKKSTKY